MDPDLIALAMRLLQGRRAARQDIAASNGTPIAPADAVSSAAGMAHSINDSPFSDEQEDARLRELSGGKYGRADVMNYLNGPHGPTGDVTPGNIARAAAQGPLMNYADELLGMARGDGAKQDFRLRQEMFAEKNPLLANVIPMATGTAAALAVPESWAAKGAGLLGVTSPVARAALTGGIMSGVASSGAADDAGFAGRAKAGAIGAAIGAPLGAAMPLVAKAAANAVSPEARVASKIGSIVDATGGPQAALASLDRFKKLGLGDVVTVADLNQQLRDAAELAAQTSPKANATITQTLQGRKEGMGQRVLSVVDNALTKLNLNTQSGAGRLAGQADRVRSTVADAFTNAKLPTNADDILGKLQASQQAWAADAYDGLRTDNPSLDLGPLQEKFQRPGVRGAWDMARLAGNINADDPLGQQIEAIMNADPSKTYAQARGSAQSAATRAADPLTPTIDKIMKANPTMSEAAAREAAPQYLALPGMTPPDAVGAEAAAPRPTSFNDLHTMRQVLDARATNAFARKGGGALGNAYVTLKNAVDDAIQEQVPASGPIDAEYARRSGNQRALNAGRLAYNDDDSRLLPQTLSAMSPDDQHLFRVGLASELTTDLSNVKAGTDAAARFSNASPALQRKLQAAFGDQSTFDNVMANLGHEQAYGAGYKAMDNADTKAVTQQYDALGRNIPPGLRVDPQGEFRTGMADNLMADLRNVRTNRDAAATLVSPSGNPASDALGTKLRLLTGDQPTFDDLMSRLQGERELRQTEGAINNSSTAKRTAAREAAGHMMGPAASLFAGYEMGGTKGLATAAATIPMQAYMRRVGAQSMDRLGSTLMLQGSKPIEDFIKSLALRNGPTALGTRVLPAAASRLPGLLQP